MERGEEERDGEEEEEEEEEVEEEQRSRRGTENARRAHKSAADIGAILASD